MEISNRTIPRVTFASLVAGAATATACGNDPSQAEQLAKTSCELFKCSFPAYFNDYYTSIADCTNQLSVEYQNAIDDYRASYGRTCTDAFVRYLQCYESYALDYCRNGNSNIDCSDEYDRYISAC